MLVSVPDSPSTPSAQFVTLIDPHSGIGLFKVSLLRFLHIRILTKVRTPLHDHVRKNMGWSNAQNPIAREPASPISSKLGVALNHR